MSVTEVKSPDHRARCVSCGNRFKDGLERPWVDVGTFDDGTEERFDTPAGAKVWTHDNIIVCGTCLEKAAKLLPGATDDANRWTADLIAAQIARDDAVKLAKELAELVSLRLSKVVTVDYDDMEPAELRDELKRLGVTLSRGNHSKETLLEKLRETVA